MFDFKEKIKSKNSCDVVVQAFPGDTFSRTRNRTHPPKNVQCKIGM